MNLNEITVRLYVNHCDSDIPMSGRGKFFYLNELVELALSSAMLSHIQLSNTGMDKISDCKHIVKQMKLCLNNGPYKYRRYDHLFGCIMRTIADKFDGSGL